MIRTCSILSALLFSAAALRADLILEQQSADTATNLQLSILKLHGAKLRMDDPGRHLSVIVDLNTRDSLTLLGSDKTYIQRFGSEVRWQLAERKKFTNGTNDLDRAPAPAVDTGKSEPVDGYQAEIYTWAGAGGLTQTLWVAPAFPNYDAIRRELAKLDKFNLSGLHRNAQPQFSQLPGMVVRSETISHGRKSSTTLVSVKVESVDASQFELPADYTPWKRPSEKQP